VAEVSTPYSTALPFVTNTPSWLNVNDAQRLAAYSLYDDLYRNNPDTVKLLLRGSDEKPIYIPTAKKIINTLSRYVLKDWGFNVVPAEDPVTGEILSPSDEEVKAAIVAYGTLFKRERFLTQLKAAKRDGLAKGDWCFYIWADPLKPPGSRISIKAIDPGIYFPITEDHDVDRVIGQDLVEQYVVGSKTFLKRQRFLKPSHPDHPNYLDMTQPIAREIRYLEINDWEDPTKQKDYTDDLGSAPPPLPMEIVPGIMQLPVYHIRNNEESGNPFGVSDLAGLEPLLAGINQTFTDQDLALAMAGLGFYWTDSGAPVDEAGEEVDWIIGPQRVVEVGEGKSFNRVSGVAAVEPSKTHVEMLENRANQTLGINDVALGAVDTTVAESGIALELRMGPLLDATDEKDEIAVEILDQMLFDLRSWFQTYEQIDLSNVVAVSVLGEKLPKNRTAEFEEAHKLYLDGVFPLEQYIVWLNEHRGYNITPEPGMEQPEEMGDRLASEAGEEPPEEPETGAE
jgi:hypothetical protein